MIAAVALLLVAIPFPAGAKISLPKASQKWIELRSSNFRFFSNAGRATTRRVAIDLEELRGVLAELTDYNLQPPVPTFIYVFKSDRSFLPYKTLYNGRPADLSGYFMSEDHANYIAINAAAQHASAVVYHEYVHYVANNNMWNLPLWLAEGLAQFYESFEVRGDTVYIGLPLLRHLALLRARTPIPLKELFAVDRHSRLYNEADRKGVFYAQSWALVHYLLLGDDERRRHLGSYLAMVHNGVGADDAFHTAFSTDYESLAAELRGYLRSFRMPWIETTTDVDLDRGLEIRRMSYAEVLYRLGDLIAAQQPTRGEARIYFERASEVDPDYGAPISALAVEAEEVADWERARTLHERAIEIDPNDPKVLFRWGEFLSRRGGDETQAVAALRRSVELDPSFAPAWATLAKAYVDSGEASEAAIEVARRAHSMRPSDVAAMRDLVRLNLRLDRRAEAVSLIEEALRSNRRVQAEAWLLVVQRDLLRARELLEDGLLAEAMQRVDLAEKIVDRSLHPAAARHNIELIRWSVREHQAAALYRRAQEMHAEDDRDGARRVLEQALELVDRGPVAAACRQLLDVVNHLDVATDVPITTFRPSPTADEIAYLNHLIAAHDFEGAIDFLERMRGRVGPRQQEWLEGRIRDIRRTLDYNRYVDEYNRAVDFFNRKQFAEAVRVLEKLLTTLPEEGRESDSVRSLLGEAREAMR